MLRQNSRFIDGSHPLSFYKGEARVRVAVYGKWCEPLTLVLSH